MKIHNHNIYEKTLEFINENELITKGERVLLALSAGKDSMALLDIFQHLREILSIEIGIFHLNHMMRAEESEEDEKFLQEMAANNKIEIFINKFDFKKKKQRKYSFEEFARIKRYEFLEKISRKNNYQKIATAHNSGDNVETILMRIFSGTGIYGLAGIECKRDNIIRPLLFLSSEKIYEHLKTNKIKWREDSSNRDDKYLRNYLRNSVIPLINKRFGKTADAILSLSNIAKENTSLINELLKEKEGELYTLYDSDVIIDKDKYLSNKILFKFIIIKILKEKFKEFVSESILEEIYKNAITRRSNALLYKNSNITIKKTLRNKKKVIVFSRDTVHNKDRFKWEYRIDLKRNNAVSIFLNEIKKGIKFEIVDYYFYLKNKGSRHLIFIALDNSIEHALIRNRQVGDRIKLEYGYKKIKDLMIDNKFDERQKESIPLLLINSQIAAYMPGIIYKQTNNRVAVDFHVVNTSKKVLAIHY